MNNICRNCGIEIAPNRFNRRVYCTETCFKEFIRKKNEARPHKLRNNEHDKYVFEVNQVLNGELQYYCLSKKYTPDIIKENSCFEVETFDKYIKLKEKVERWDKSQKHILIIAPFNKCADLFDEVYAYYKNKLVQIK